jgi:hypothetical protein
MYSTGLQSECLGTKTVKSPSVFRSSNSAALFFPPYYVISWHNTSTKGYTGDSGGYLVIPGGLTATSLAKL